MYSQILRRDWQLPSIRSVVSAGYTRLKHLSRGKPNHGRIARLPCRSCVDIAWNLSCPHAGSLQCIWATTMFVPESPIPLRLVVSIFVTARSPFSSSSILALQLNLSRWSQSLGREPWLVKPAWKQTSCCPADSAPRIPPCAVPPLPGPGAAGWRAALPAAPWAAWRWWRPWLGPPFAAQRPWRRRGWRWCMARSWYLELWADIWDDNYLECFFFLGGVIAACFNNLHLWNDPNGCLEIETTRAWLMMGVGSDFLTKYKKAANLPRLYLSTVERWCWNPAGDSLEPVLPEGAIPGQGRGQRRPPSNFDRTDWRCQLGDHPRDLWPWRYGAIHWGTIHWRARLLDEYALFLFRYLMTSRSHPRIIGIPDLVLICIDSSSRNPFLFHPRPGL